MPNWMSNDLTIICDSKESAEKYFELFKGEGRDLDFEKIIPRPECLNIEAGSSGERGLYYLYANASEKDKKIIDDAYRSCNPFHGHIYEDYKDEDPVKYKECENNGIAYLDNFKETGYCEWYNWNCDNWGTKWNSVDTSATLDGNEINYIFDTAWSVPRPIISKIASLEGVELAQERFVEEGMQTAGEYYIKHQNPLEEIYIESPETVLELIWFASYHDFAYFLEELKYCRIDEEELEEFFDSHGNNFSKEEIEELLQAVKENAIIHQIKDIQIEVQREFWPSIEKISSEQRIALYEKSDQYLKSLEKEYKERKSAPNKGEEEAIKITFKEIYHEYTNGKIENNIEPAL